jgi:putative ABC transport system ATP-binding protein
MENLEDVTMGVAMAARQDEQARAMLSLQNLKKVFRTEDVETTALDAVSIDISRGEFVSIMGPSGCGKSTLLNIIGLLDNVDGGKYWFLGEEVSTYGERKLAQLRKHNIGFIFQSFNLIDELSVFDNVELPLLYQKVPAKERRERVDAMLEKIGIFTRRDHMPQQLSGGQQQRVAVARALVGRPAMILADEPTGNLDSRNGEEVMDLLTHLNREGTTVVMVTHSQQHAEYAQRIINMLDGRVLSENLLGSRY